MWRILLNYESAAVGRVSLAPRLRGAEDPGRGPLFPLPPNLPRFGEFFAAWPGAAVFEDSRLLFDLRLARCPVTAEHGRGLLPLWSVERNRVRTVTAILPRRETLRLQPERWRESMLRCDLSVLEPSAWRRAGVLAGTGVHLGQPNAARFCWR
jgi:hypothetical protein